MASKVPRTIEPETGNSREAPMLFEREIIQTVVQPNHPLGERHGIPSLRRRWGLLCAGRRDRFWRAKEILQSVLKWTESRAQGGGRNYD
jgi:hypothetical protein